MTDIHLISWNRPKMTELVIKTLAHNTHRDNYRLVVIDNDSEMETKQMLVRLQDNGFIDELCILDKNIGLEGAREYALKNCTESNYFVCLDNDCLAPKPLDGYDWIDQMMELMQKYEDYAAISMRTQVMIGTGNIFEDSDKNGDDIIDFPHPGGSFRIMDTRATELVLGWIEAKPGRGAEERLVCGKLREAGFKTAFAVKVRCLHLFGWREHTKERWGYSEDLKPEDTGHSDIAHPALTNGDDKEEMLLYARKEDIDAYCSTSQTKS